MLQINSPVTAIGFANEMAKASVLTATLHAEIPCEWTLVTKLAGDCECDGLVHPDVYLKGFTQPRPREGVQYMLPFQRKATKTEARPRPTPQGLPEAAQNRAKRTEMDRIGHLGGCQMLGGGVVIIEFSREHPEEATTLLHFSKRSRPFIQSVKSTLSYPKSCNPVGGIPSSSA